MQKRITQLIGNISNENIIGDLLRINDDLNNSFLRYERFEKSISHTDNNNSSYNNNNNHSKINKDMPATVKKPEEKPLIEFDDEDESLMNSKTAAGPVQSKKKEMPDDDESDINQVFSLDVI